MIARVQDWYAPRQRVLRWIAAGWMTYFLVFGVSWLLWPRYPPITAAADRLIVAVQLAAGPSLVLFVMLQGLWRTNDTVEAENPLLGRESERFRINQRVLTNTLEQGAMFVPLLLALAVRMAPDQVYLLPLLTTIWCVGRMLFWLGYQIDPVYRAIGMDWTSGVLFTTAGLFLVSLA